MITLDEFMKTVYHTRESIVVPCLNRMRINKGKFMVKGKYSIDKQYEYLEELYYKNFS